MSTPEPSSPFVVTFLARLRDELLAARKARDAIRTSALRTTIAAIENAEAPPVDGPAWPPQEGPSRDHARLELSESQVRAVVRHEIDERRRDADELDGVGQQQRASELRAEADVLAPLLEVS